MALSQETTMDNVMLDLETMATSSNAVVVSLGAVYFNEHKTGDTFYRVLDVDEQLARNREVSPQTMEWWAKQSAAARAVFDEKGWPVKTVLEQFAEFLGDRNLKIWGNGSDFDNILVGSLYEMWGIKRPWSYSNNRCYRTLKNVAFANSSHALPARRNVHHNALDDAVYQAELAGYYMRGRLKWAS